MATLNLMFSDLKAGCCANTVESWLLRFGVACNVKKGRELIRPTCCIVIISSLVNYNNGPVLVGSQKLWWVSRLVGHSQLNFVNYFIFTELLFHGRKLKTTSLSLKLRLCSSMSFTSVSCLRWVFFISFYCILLYTVSIL